MQSCRGSHTRSQILPAPVWTSHEVTASFGHLVDLGGVWGPPQAAGESLLHLWAPWAAGASLTHLGCWGICALPGAPPPAPSALILVFAGLCLSHILTPLFSCNFEVFFFPTLLIVIPKALLPSLLGWALASSGASWSTGSLGNVGRLLTRSHSCSSPSTTTLTGKASRDLAYRSTQTAETYS